MTGPRRGRPTYADPAGDQYAGVRVTMQAKVSTAQVKLALDVNFGDPVTPEAGWIDYPSVLPAGSSVRLRGYPWPPCSPRSSSPR